MPDTRLPSRGRHRAPAAPTSAPLKARLRSKTAKGGLALALVLSLGGYTVAEATTQREAVAAEQTAVAAADKARAQVAAERARAVDTARYAVSEATAVQDSASDSLSKADLAPLVAAVAELNEMVDKVPAPEGAVAASGTTAPARASRGVTRGPVPTSLQETSAADPAAVPAAADAGDAPVDSAARAPSAAPNAMGDLLRKPPVPATDKVAAGIELATAKVAELTAEAKVTAEAKAAAAEVAAQAAAEAAAKAEAEQVAAAKAKKAAELAAQKAAQKAAQRKSLASFENGKIPDDALCTVTFDSTQQLRCDAADSLVKMNASYKETFGGNIAITDSYRNYSSQVACLVSKGGLCAAPGTSNHGLGVAVDYGGGIQSFGTRQHMWMVENAGDFGWELPDWAQASGSKPEAWHWEYTG